MSFKRKKAHPQRANGKGKKKAISELTVNSQRIGVTLKLEAIKTTFSVQGQLEAPKSLHWVACGTRYTKKEVTELGGIELQRSS